MHQKISAKINYFTAFTFKNFFLVTKYGAHLECEEGKSMLIDASASFFLVKQSDTRSEFS